MQDVIKLFVGLDAISRRAAPRGRRDSYNPGWLACAPDGSARTQRDVLRVNDSGDEQ